MFLQSIPFLGYPPTAHIAGSRLQFGDSAKDQTPLANIAGKWGVIEEKLDGANAGLSFGEGGDLRLQSRGHYLLGGWNERQFALFKTWARAHEDRLLALLEDRYTLFGEWLHAKHSIWYDCLPHLLAEFDIWDRSRQIFLSTTARRSLLAGSPVLSVPVLYEGPIPGDLRQLLALVKPALAKSTNWRVRLRDAIARAGMPMELTLKQTDQSDLAEGLYIKVEDEHQVLGRYKLVREDFTQTILNSGSHHARRPILPNQLHPDADLFAPCPSVTWEDLGLQTVHSLSSRTARGRD